MSDFMGNKHTMLSFYFITITTVARGLVQGCTMIGVHWPKFYLSSVFGPILDDMLKENSFLKPWNTKISKQTKYIKMGCQKENGKYFH